VYDDAISDAIYVELLGTTIISDSLVAVLYDYCSDIAMCGG
jgi:hypothetical protein